MIADTLRNAHLYESIAPRLARGFEYLTSTDFLRIDPGKYELDGTALYAMVSDYTTKPPAAGRWEAHRRYIDLQYVARGVERVGVSPIDLMDGGAYDSEKDLVWLTGTGDFITLREGSFAVLWPGDAHMPGIAVDTPAPVRKVVVKIAM